MQLHKLRSKFKILKSFNLTMIIFSIIIVFIFVQILVFSPSDVNLFNKNTDSSDKRSTVSKGQLAQQVQKDKKSVEQQMRGIHLVENNKNQKGWELFAEEASGSEDANWVLKKVKIEFYADDQSAYTVTGDVGEINGTSKDILIRGQVITTSTNGYEFKTNDLRFHSKTKLLTTNDFVQMTGPADDSGPGFSMTGTGLKIDLNKNKMQILSSVEAEKIINKNKFQINSKTAEFSNRSQEAAFMGAVQMKYQKATLLAPIAFFKYSNTKKILKTVLLQQGVTLKEIERSGQCKELEIDLEEDKMTLRGAPKVQMGEDQIVGDEIVFLDGGKKVKINNVKATGKK